MKQQMRDGGKEGRRRLGGKGLSLPAFVAAKSKSVHNPNEIKKQREQYQNANKVRKYKRLMKNLQSKNDQEAQPVENQVGTSEQKQARGQNTKKRGLGFNSRLREDYENKQAELAAAKEKREKEMAEKSEARERAEECRKNTKSKMLKRTSRGQPVMKHRLEQLLSSIEAGSK